MSRILKNNRGHSLVEIMTGAVVTLLVFSAFGQFMVFQSRSVFSIHQKAESYRLQTFMGRVMADRETCSCFFDSTNTLNRVRGDLRVDPDDVIAKQQAGDLGPTMPLRWLETIPTSANGQCDYGKAYSVAVPQQYFGDPIMGLMVDKVEVRNIRLAGSYDAASSIRHMRGILTVSFLKTDPVTGKNLLHRPLAAVESEVNFFTDESGFSQTCDAGDQIMKFFAKKQDGFKSSVQGQFTNISNTFVEANSGRVPAAISGSEPVIVQNYNDTLAQGIAEIRALGR